jgi:hypothetical protein
MSQLAIIGHPESNPIIEGTRNSVFTVAFKNAISSDTTVTVTDVNGYATVTNGSLTFTSANYNVPQKVTLSASNNSITDGFRWARISIAVTGGETVYRDCIILDNGADSNYIQAAIGFRRWIDEVRITNLTTAASQAAALLAAAFNGNGLPTNAVPTAIVNNYTGTLHNISSHTLLTGYSSIDKLSFTMTDVNGDTWTNVVYHIHATTGNGKAFFNHEGHSELLHKDLINALLADGFDVFHTSMPAQKDNSETSSVITQTGVNGHNQILSGGIDRAGYYGLPMYIFDKIMAYNYAEANYNYTNYYGAGISGGSVGAIYMGIFLPAIEKTFLCRAWSHRSLNTTEPDYEGGGTRSLSTNCGPRMKALFDTLESADLLLMACTSGRKVVVYHNTYDTAVPAATNGNYLALFGPKMVEFASRVNGTIEYIIDTDSGRAAHGYDSNLISIIETELGY